VWTASGLMEDAIGRVTGGSEDPPYESST
jgi:hypothetical protein